MNKLWLRKMIWSYIPLFLIIFSFLFFIFFQTLVDQNRKNALASSTVFTAQLLQSVDVSLKTVDHTVIRELLNNKLLADFFEEPGDSNVYLNYEVLRRLTELKQEVPLIDSFYLYRYNDLRIFTGNAIKSVSDFNDEDFARKMVRDTAKQHWTDLRSYREFAFQNKKQVVSLVHQVPLNSGSDGLFVVNIDLASFKTMVSGLYDPGRTFVNIFDRNGHPIYTDNAQTERKVLASLESDYTGWKIESGLYNGHLVSAVSAFSSVWFAFGVLVFAAGLVLIIYITRANYKPMEDLVVRLNHSLFEGKHTTGSLAVDEFAFIESAINNFAAQSKLLEKEFNEAALLKRKNLFNAMASGEQGDESLTEGLQVPFFRRLTVIMIEIDNPEQSFFTYSGRDRSLFKFVLSSVTNEMVQQRGMAVWLEWTSPVHLTGIVFLPETEQDLPGICEAVVGWVNKNLKFTVTIGIGRPAGGLETAGLSYEEARSLLHFKAVLGNNRIIGYSDAANPQQMDKNRHLRTIRELAAAFRLNDEQWKAHFDELFDGIRSARPARAGIVEIVHYLLAYLELDLSDRSKEESEAWTEALAEAGAAVESFDTLEELRLSLYKVLETCDERLMTVRASRHYHQLMNEVKGFIEREYANPDLSLDYLSDKFSINAKYLSQLFKETFGENFLDFLMSVRIDHAKDDLLQGADSIQEVGERVGYRNAATFRRVFRKVEGVSPQDYRKRAQS